MAGKIVVDFVLRHVEHPLHLAGQCGPLRQRFSQVLHVAALPGRVRLLRRLTTRLQGNTLAKEDHRTRLGRAPAERPGSDRGAASHTVRARPAVLGIGIGIGIGIGQRATGNGIGQR
ncbi:hypothetical protein [Streptomyces sp. NBC_00273]|uniref:hypothetical protein n=1 Tax=Streptomyces sp. NBC_00273 TaxID=2903644 RepID=UPI002E2B9FD0|nr:hypothetical protein [Streptomyces sp. NBC_00273]